MLRPVNKYSPLFMGFLTFVWGLWLVNPNVDTFDSAPVFSKMAEIAPEGSWGLWAIVLGWATISTTIKKNYDALAVILVGTTWLWSVIAGFMWWGDWTNTAGIVYTFIAIHSCFLYLNIKINYSIH